jgi:hypothetical protein
MKDPLYVLCCDIDAGEHGIHGTIHECYNKATEIIKLQPYHIDCELKDFYVMEYVEGQETGKMINMEAWYDSADFYGEKV